MKLSSHTIGSTSRKLSYGSQLQPQRDWFVLLAIFAVVILLSIAWNMWQFSRVVNGQQIGSESPVVAAPIKLNTVRALFEERAQERESYEGTYRFVDPSL